MNNLIIQFIICLCLFLKMDTLTLTFCAALAVLIDEDRLSLPQLIPTTDRGSPTTNATLLLAQADMEKKGGWGGMSRKNNSFSNIAEQDAAPMDTIRVRGVCDRLAVLNADFTKQGVTADNRSYYKSTIFGAYYLYYDKDCSGDGKHLPLWIFDNDKPNTSAASDLDGDGDCLFIGYTDSSTVLPPKSAVWTLNCDGGWTDIPLTINWYAGWHVCPPGSFCKGDGCPSNIATAAVPRDRWNPDNVRACDEVADVVSCEGKRMASHYKYYYTYSPIKVEAPSKLVCVRPAYQACML